MALIEGGGTDKPYWDPNKKYPNRAAWQAARDKYEADLDAYNARQNPSNNSNSNSNNNSSSNTPTSTTTSTTDKDNDGKTDYTDSDATRFNGIPGKPDVWKDAETGVYYLVYYPESGPQPPVPLLFTISTDEELKSLFGKDKPVADKTLSADDMQKAGAVKFGEMASLDRYNAANELIEDPWAGFTSRMERATASMPWLAEDPEVFALVAGAYLEGRELETWELEQTEYFQSHSEAERDAIRFQLSDPEGYKDRKDAYSSDIYDEISKYGIDPNDDVVGWVADKYNSGEWTLDQAMGQVRAYADGGGPLEIDEDFQTFLDENDVDTGGATTGISEVYDLYDEWLGPAFPPDEKSVADWASRFRDDPQGARAALTEELRGQRMTLFPEYENENTTYRSAAAPWKSFTQGVWGVPLDEADPAFQSIVQANNAEAGQEIARKTGSERGYAKVTEGMFNDIQQSMRQGVRGAV